MILYFPRLDVWMKGSWKARSIVGLIVKTVSKISLANVLSREKTFDNSFNQLMLTVL